VNGSLSSISREEADHCDRGGRKNLAALISLGIPKLVRFAKIRPQQPYTVHIVLSYLIRPPSACSLPARRIERADGALAPRQRDAFGRSSLASRAPTSDKMATSLSAPGLNAFG
jgi:hypothetical protein